MRMKKEPGRPVGGCPPRLAGVLLDDGRPAKPVNGNKVHRCVDCKRVVYYPEVLYNDRICPKCHAQSPA